MRRWENFDLAHSNLKLAEVSKLPLEELKPLSGIVFRHHGRFFKDPEIRRYLEERTWFQPNPGFQNSMLNDLERRNLDLSSRR